MGVAPGELSQVDGERGEIKGLKNPEFEKIVLFHVAKVCIYIPPYLLGLPTLSW